MATRIRDEQLRQIIEAAILVADAPMSLNGLRSSVLESFAVTMPRLREAVETLQQEYAGRGINLVEVASGYRFQSAPAVSPFLSRLWVERAPRFSRATLETLALIAYRQPITRPEIEAVRGVTVSSQIIRTLLERDWIKVVGHREVPGRPALYGTTPAFLDYFSLTSLNELPDLTFPDEDDESALAADVDDTVLDSSGNSDDNADNAATANH